MNEYLQLQDIFNLAHGKYWQWKEDFQRNGSPWSFHNYSRYNPCQQYWQGVYCMEDDDAVGHIFSIDLTGFNLTGTLPETIQDFPMLYFFLVGSNNLHGKIPTFQNTPMLQMVNFSYNAFSGQIPDHFLDASYQYLSLIYLSNNYLSGTIPSIVYNFTNQLAYLNLYNNSFVGTLSKEISNLQNLFYLNVGRNKLHGILPAEALSQLPKIQQLFLDTNYFSGPLPSQLSKYMDILWLNDNFFTGSIPRQYCAFSNLTVLKLEYNYLTGSLPKCSERLSLLYILQVQNNQFTGTLTNYFVPQNFQYLSVVDISDNAFSGSFPVGVFQLPALKSIAAVKNCFLGRIPESICDEDNNMTESIEVVALDGLHASTYCTTHYWSPFRSSSDTGSFSKLMSGSLPCCLWRLPNITTLHFSGNGFTGTMPQFSSDLSQTLVDVSISHNRLTGTIPVVVLNHSFSNLDLSYNKLYGTIDHFTNMPFSSDANAHSTSASLNLENNRLSGLIPSPLGDAYNVQILQGNIFDCDSKEPVHDPNAKNYICGSQELDTASLIFVMFSASFLFLVLIGTVTIFHILRRRESGNLSSKELPEREPSQVRWKQFLQQGYEFCKYTYKSLLNIQDMIIKTYRYAVTCDESQILLLKYLNVYQFLYALLLIQKISIVIAGFTVVLCFPVYISYYYLGDATYSKYENKYSWIGTSVFLTGDAPAITLLALWYTLILVVLVMVYYHYHIHYRKNTTWNKFKSFFGSFDEQRDGDKISAIYSPLNQSERNSEIIKESALDLLEQEDNLEDSTERLSETLGVKTADRESLTKEGTTNRWSFISHSKSAPRESLGITNQSVFSTPQTYESKRPSFYRQSATTRKSFLSFLSLSGSKHDRSSFASINSSSHYSMFHIPGERVSDLVNQEERSIRLRYYLLYFSVLAINIIVSITVNAAYLVMEEADDLSTVTKEFMQVFMAIFKLIWNIFVIRNMVNQIQPYRKNVARLHVFMLVFNSIVAPCIATAFTDSSCFNDVFAVADTITASYDIITCTESTQALNPSTGRLYTSCTKHVSLCFKTEFTPSFIYYYSCGSKLLTAYIPVFIYTYGILLFASIILYTLLAQVNLKFLPGFIVQKIDGVLRPKEAGGSLVFERLIKAHTIQALLTSHIIVLLTFGVNSPILAVIMAITISVNCGIWQLMIVRYIKYDAWCQNNPISSNTTLTSLTKSSNSKEENKQLKSSSFLSSLGGDRISDLTISNNSNAEITHEIVIPTVASPQEPPQKSEIISNTLITSSSLTKHPSSPLNIASNDLEAKTTFDKESPAEEEENVQFPPSNNSLHSWDSSEFFHCSKEEEARLNELNTIIDDAWQCIYHTRWLIVFVSLLFYILILFDLAGDQQSAIHALWVPGVIVVLILITRLFLMDTLKYIQIHYC